MKVILNKDLAPLGEEGDVKDVAKGYARNFLFPRGIALPYTDQTVKLFEARREEIDARKEEKRKDAAGIREKLEALEMVITMPAGANGKLYGAVTSQTVAEELLKAGFQMERKRIELPGNTIKSVGKYKVVVKLYESAAAEIGVTVRGQEIKVETRAAPPRKGRRRDAGQAESPREETGPRPEAAPAETVPAPVEAAPAPVEAVRTPVEAVPAPAEAAPAETAAAE
ncbi:MAG: 50S ribosomal protein L9 [Spirochaetaceae bacterium]|nr:50S ribosomal protein L9 [Spirochaetaceae bacterium]